MVCLVRRRCSECKEEYNSTIDDLENLCLDCKMEIEGSKREKHFRELDKLTLEERVRKIEEWIYDYKPIHVRPPRF